MERDELFVMTAPGLENVLARELRELGIVVKGTEPGGASFAGGMEHMQRVNLWSRVANRVLKRLATFHAASFHELERRAKTIAWESYVTPGRAASFRVTCRKSKLYHSDAVAQRLRDATGTRAVPGGAGDEDFDGAQVFVVRIVHDICTISADSSGELLHRRGYRQEVAKAPLRENLAAAMLMAAGWSGDSALIDPMCGSGTIPIEAALLARNIAPGLDRGFAFEHWPDHDAKEWEVLRANALSRVRPRVGFPIVGSDRDAGAVAAARGNAERAGVVDSVEFQEAAVSAAPYPEPPGLVITNPPYGRRVGEGKDLRNLYSQLGRIARGPAAGLGFAALSADRTLETRLGREFREAFRTANGGIPVRLVVADPSA